MRSFLHILKKIGKIALIIPIFALLYFLSAWMMASLPLNEEQPKGEITLFLVSNGVHTDVVMPLKNDIFDWSDVVNPKTRSLLILRYAYRFRLGGAPIFIYTRLSGKI